MTTSPGVGEQIVTSAPPVAQGHLRVVATLALALLAPAAAAWDGHAPLTAAALAGAPGARSTVRAEPIEAFLADDPVRLAAALDAEERWAGAHVPSWPALPAPLAFRPADGVRDLRGRFLAAVRMNPATRLALAVQEEIAPGAPRSGRPALAWEAVGTLPTAPHPDRIAFRALAPGEAVGALEVVASASDEPDYGSDVGLFEDSGTEAGARYGLGRLPFGNPDLPYATQAPFHMGFFHESWVLYRLAPALRRVWPEVRIHQAETLSRLAFASGHPYWGWRFLGWGLHYVQDLTQPWHASIDPSASWVGPLVAASVLDLVGVHGPKRARVQLLSNRHLAFEAWTFEEIRREVSAGGGPLLGALADDRADAGAAPYADAHPRQVVSAFAHERARAADAALRAALPALWVDDPSFHLGAPGVEIDPLRYTEERARPADRERLAAVTSELLRGCGLFTRFFARAVTASAARRAPTEHAWTP